MTSITWERALAEQGHPFKHQPPVDYVYKCVVAYPHLAHLPLSCSWYPIHYAVGPHSHRPLFDELMRLDVDLNAMTCAGVTAFTRCFDTGMLIELYQRGADINRIDSMGRNALHYRCSRLSLDGVAAIMDMGCAYDIRDIEGETPFDLYQKMLRWNPNLEAFPDHIVNYLKTGKRVYHAKRAGR